MKRILLLCSIPCLLICGGMYVLAHHPKKSYEQTLENAPKSWVAGSGMHAHVYPLFSPDYNLKQTLIDCIDHENAGIFIASFRFTDKDIAQALLRAFQRGVKVELVVDRGCLGIVHSKVLLLSQYHIPVYTYPPLSHDIADAHKISSAALMHNKFMIFQAQSLVWTGSYNFTSAAQSMHQENAVLMYGYDIAQAYAHHFEILKKRSSLISKKRLRIKKSYK